MDTYLQTNNDLIISIHKALTDSTQELNRKIEGLRDDVRDVKLSLVNNDRSIQEEANHWRQHTENIVKELGDRHQHEVESLHKLVMELCIRGPPPLQKAPLTAPPNQEYNTGQKEQQIKPELAVSQKEIAKKAEEPVGFKPAMELFRGPPPFQKAPLTAPLNQEYNTGQKEQQIKPELAVSKKEIVKKAEETVGFKPPSFEATIAPPITTTTQTTTVAPTSSINFSFKSPASMVTAGAGGASLFQGPATTGTNNGGSLFGGGVKTGSNTFANLAAKATESGGGFLISGTAIGGKQTFGQSLFTSKDFKLFQQPSPQPSLDSSVRSSPKGANASQHADEGSDKEDQNEEFVPDVHYEPVVPLPPEIEVATGEEEEEVMFASRCKLYRFDKEAKENKERGLGDIKLLFNPVTNRYRCVMRREQVYKLCANFPIYPDLKLHPREQMPTVYTWACKDFSEDTADGTDETFSVRFKDKNIAQEFYEKMLEAIEKSGEQ